ncbi:MAG TPA: hypothetical protein DEF42_20165 [Desulfosporosinus sp.]|nr:hypothetical protein [Desulfosporosinus sp.]
MKIGIRLRFLLIILALIILPIVVTVTSLYMTTNKMKDLLDPTSLESFTHQIDRVNKETARKIVDEFSNIHQYDVFTAALEPLISKYQLHIRIVDPSGVLYDSEDKLGWQDQEPSHLPQDTLAVSWNQSLRLNPFQYSLPIVIEGKQVATALIDVNPSVPPYNVFAEILKGILSSFGWGFLALILLIVLFTWYFSRTILRPIDDLSLATQKISEGNLEFSLEYHRKDELGKFVRSFNNMRDQLKESLEKQNAYEQSRKALIASISHDLRTPISSIKGYVEGLQDGIVEDEASVKRYLSIIHQKTDQLNRQIQDLFQFSQFDLGQLEVKLVPEDSREVLESILEPYELEFNKDKGKLTLIIDRPLPSVQILVDRQRIEQVLLNLLSNAQRYASEGGRMQVKAYVKKPNLIISVSDNGPGISQEDIPHIFESFYRGEKSRSPMYGGTGLGLAISKSIVEAHQGKLWVESNEGQGSTFSFSLKIPTTGNL